MSFIKANDPSLSSWLEAGAKSDFPLQNIPFGIGGISGADPVPCTRVGDNVISLASLADHGYFDDLGIEDLGIFYEPFLNPMIALGKEITGKIRERLSALLSDGNEELKGNEEAVKEAIMPVGSVEMHMPVVVGDYTDFYASEYHATNVGIMFRDPENALLPNWKHIPVGYHGRASSIVVSGTPIHRPKGQTLPGDARSPVFGPSKLFDFELEMAFITGKKTELGQSVDINNAEKYIFGLVLFNDLSARDIQKWEYVPLGPFLGKNFGSVISPWIVTLEALEPFRVDGPDQDPEVLPYLQFTGAKNYDLDLEVYIQPENQEPFKVCHSNFKYMYWNMAQQLAHHTVNGCNINVGDMYASGTISGPEPGSFGSMLEIAWKGTKPVKMPDGSERKFIQDHDTIIIKGYGTSNGVRIGFGESVTRVLPAK